MKGKCGVCGSRKLLQCDDNGIEILRKTILIRKTLEKTTEEILKRKKSLEKTEKNLESQIGIKILEKGIYKINIPSLFREKYIFLDKEKVLHLHLPYLLKIKENKES